MEPDTGKTRVLAQAQEARPEARGHGVALVLGFVTTACIAFLLAFFGTPAFSPVAFLIAFVGGAIVTGLVWLLS